MMYYDTDEELVRFLEVDRYHTPCPHCHAVGTLLRHGTWTGFGEGTEKILRGYRFFCSDRHCHKGKGCGGTFGLMEAERMPYFWITARTLFQYLLAVAAGVAKAQALRAGLPSFHPSGAYRIFRRLSLPRIRSFLYRLSHDPPSGATPLASTVDHLRSLFQTPSPIATFQRHFQTAFLEAGAPVLPN